jgi:hypothetical protein
MDNGTFFYPGYLEKDYCTFGERFNGMRHSRDTVETVDIFKGVLNKPEPPYPPKATDMIISTKSRPSQPLQSKSVVPQSKSVVPQSKSVVPQSKSVVPQSNQEPAATGPPTTKHHDEGSSIKPPGAPIKQPAIKSQPALSSPSSHQTKTTTRNQESARQPLISHMSCVPSAGSGQSATTTSKKKKSTAGNTGSNQLTSNMPSATSTRGLGDGERKNKKNRGKRKKEKERKENVLMGASTPANSNSGASSSKMSHTAASNLEQEKRRQDEPQRNGMVSLYHWMC